MVSCVSWCRGGCLRCWFSSVDGSRMRLELDSFGGGAEIS